MKTSRDGAGERLSDGSGLLAPVLVIIGAIILAKAAYDGYRFWGESPLRHGGWYLAVVLGALLGLRLFQHAVRLNLRAGTEAGDTVASVLACFWMPATVLCSTGPLQAWSWCVPAGVLLVFLAPAWAVWIVSTLSVLAVGAASAIEFSNADACVIAGVMGATNLLGAHFRSATERQQRAVAKRLDRMNLAMCSTRSGTVEWDATADIFIFSDRFKQLLGYEAQEAMPSQNFFDYVHPDDRPEIEHSVALQLKEAKGQPLFRMRPYEYRLVDRAGESVWIHAEAFLLGDADGKAHILCTLLDISDGIRIRHALDAAHRQVERHAQRMSDQAKALERAVQIRQEVESLIRDRLHQPLSALVAMVRNWPDRQEADASLNASQPQGVHESAGPSHAAGDPGVPTSPAVAADSTISITESILAFLDFRAMEEGRFERALLKTDLALLVGLTVSKFREKARGKRVDLMVIEPSVFEPILADAQLCTRCLEAALDQAIEMSPAGKAVTLRPCPPGGTGLSIEVAVQLTSTELREMLAPVRARPSQAARVATMYEARLGLQAMRGHLVVDSSREHGTRFGLEFAAAPCCAPAPGAGQPTPVVGDVEDAREVSATRMNSSESLRQLSSSAPQAAQTQESIALDVAVLLVTDALWIQQHAKTQLALSLDKSAVVRFDEALGAFASTRFDIVALCPTLEPEAGDLLRQMRRMQRAALEDASLFVALVPTDQMRDSSLESHFDRILRLPLQPAAVDDLARWVQLQRAALPAAPWVDAKIVSAYPEYLASRKRLVDKLASAVLAGQVADASIIAHTLIGSPGLHGFEEGFEVCEKIKSEASVITATPEILHAVERLGAMFDSALVR